MPTEGLRELIETSIGSLSEDVRGIRVDLDRLLDAVGTPRSDAVPLGLERPIITEIQTLKRRMGDMEQTMLSLAGLPSAVEALTKSALAEADDRRWLKRAVLAVLISAFVAGAIGAWWVGVQVQLAEASPGAIEAELEE